MKKISLFCMVYITALSCLAQNKTFDLIEYVVPKNAPGKEWKEEKAGNITSYATTNKNAASWCRIAIVKSTTSKGNIDTDFESEWQALVVKNYKPTNTAELSEVEEADGWKIKTGSAKFRFNDQDAIAMLTSASGFERCVSIVVTTNSQDYLSEIQSFLESVKLKKNNNPPDKKQIVQTSSTTAQP
ncbi:MAG TPA: hypothetical protein VF476_14890, partial [Chitinophagaceae bacterium]